MGGSLLLAPTCGLLNHFLPLPALFRSTSLTLISFAKHKTLVQTQKGKVKNSAEKLHILLPTTYISYGTPRPAPKIAERRCLFLQFDKNTYLAKCSCLVCFSGMQSKFGEVVIVLSYQQVVGPRVTSGAGNLRLCQGKTLALLPANLLPTPSSPCPLSLPSTHCHFP